MGGAAPDLYQLLGLPRYENDPQRIMAAADERMRLVRSFQSGPRGAYTQALLNELSGARLYLLAPEKKRSYDAALRQGELLRVVGPHETPIEEPPVAIPATAGAPDAFPFDAEHDERDRLSDDEATESFFSPMLFVGLVFAVMAVGMVTWLLGGWLVRAPWFTGEGAAPAVSPQGRISGKPADRKAAPKSVAPNRPAIEVQQEGSGEIVLSPATADVDAPLYAHAVGTEVALAGWKSPQSAARWSLRLARPGFFRVHLTYAADEDAVGSRMELTIDEDRRTFELAASGDGEMFRTDILLVAIPKSGRHLLTLRPVDELAGGVQVKSIRLTPVGGTP